MTEHSLTFVYPGDINTRTGGYRYDKRLLEELRALDTNENRWIVNQLSLDGDYPFPNKSQLEKAALRFSELKDGSLVVVDGLAYSVMPQIIATHANRLTMVALIHHPLALETGLTKAQRTLLHTQEKQALQYAQHVITTSQTTADSLANYSIPLHKVTAILPGTDAAPLARGSNSNTLNLLCVATLTQRKAHNVLLEALASISELPWHLHCVGSTTRDSATYQSLVQKCASQALQHRVTFTGELDDTALQHQFESADLFVLASLHEGYGMVLSEAISYGLPIVCTNAGAMAQTAPQGAAILVPPGDAKALADALEKVISSAAIRAELQSAARKARTDGRSWRKAAGEFASLLTQLSRTCNKSMQR